MSVFKPSNYFYSMVLAGVLAFAVTLAATSDLFASGPLAQPTGTVILTITGNLTHTNAPGRADFDRDMLEALGMETLITTTSWNDGKQTFEGVPLKRVMDLLEARGDTIIGTALNDYRNEIPFSEIKTYNPVLALKRNGKYMTVRDKGPLWIVYPRDDYKELMKVEYDHRWIWQLKSLHVK